jgi:hypothetical protein
MPDRTSNGGCKIFVTLRSPRMTARFSRPSPSWSALEHSILEGTESAECKKEALRLGVNYSAGPNARRSNDRTAKGGALAM